MGRNDESKRTSEQGESPEPRVYKSNAVHKRRASAKARADASDEAAGGKPEDGQADAGAKAVAEAPGKADAGNDAAIAPDTAASPQGSQDEPGESPSADGVDGGVEDEFDEHAPDSPVEGEDRSAAKTRKRLITPKRVLFVLVGIIVIAAVGFFSAFAWNRWGRYDDHADMQGQWYVLGTTVSVTVDATSINLTDSVSYVYEIDDHDKTIRYTFGPMKGQGRYWFSDDRNNLAIIDGEGFTGAGNTFDDLMHSFFGFPSADGGTSTRPPEGEGTIVFTRQPGVLAVMAHEAFEREKARAKALKARREAAELEEGSVEGEQSDPEASGEEMAETESADTAASATDADADADAETGGGGADGDEGASPVEPDVASNPDADADSKAAASASRSAASGDDTFATTPNDVPAAEDAGE